MAEKENMSLPLSCALFACFSAANSLICAPFGGNILPFSFALLVGIIFIWLASFAFFRLLGAKKNTVIKICLILFCVFAFCAAGFSSAQYCEFIYRAVLTRSDMWAIKVVFALCVFALALSNDFAIYKFALLSALFSGAVFFVLFLLSSKTFDVQNLSGAFDVSGLSLSVFGEYFLKLILPTLVAVMFASLTDRSVPSAGAICGACIGAGFCLAVVFDSALSFGMPLSNKLRYTYIDDISTVTLGNLFTRMDAFAYFAFFACYVLKCAVCINVISKLLCIVGIKKKAPVAAVCAAAMMLFE